MKRTGLLGLGILAAVPAVISAQNVIINEWSQGNGGNKEWIEALVVSGPADLRGLVFSDGTHDETDSPQLSTDANWSAVPAGTLIVVYNGNDVDTTIVPDTNFADSNFTISVAHDDATLMVAGRSFQAFSNGTATDNARLLTSTGAVVHDWDQADDAAFTAGTLRPGSAQTVQFDGNSAAGASDAANWTRIGSPVATPGQPNGAASANETWILSLRGVAADDPNIDASAETVRMGRILPSATQDVNIVVNNAGTSANLDVAGSTITGANASAFSIVSQPTGIAPGGSGNLVVRFDPAGTPGVYEATLTINSNDTSGDTVVVPLVGSAADVSSYAGLYITEVVSTPTADELVEIQNTSAGSIDISGVIISDEDNSNSEGALKFPAGTVLAAGEVAVVAVNSDAVNAPSWLGTVPSGTRVFYDPIRLGTWTAPSGVTLVAMEDFTDATGGTTGVVALSSDDGVALYHPLTIFSALYGPSAPGMAIDGLNYDDSATSPLHPINSNGDFDTQATRVGTGQHAAGSSIKRVGAAVNTASNVAFAVSETMTPGVGVVASSVAGWNLY
ncbi:MAG: trimeric autotransporter adhesin [Candidatus Sumerlaeota bacterium]|nr:trimeric autotransporter adhesin [Candidatus Sumerlaeota bacterium]